MLPMFAKHVDVETAQQVARNFWELNVAKSDGVAFIDVTSQTEFSNFYIFNTNGGFVIVSSDDIAYPVLGYSDEGSFNTSNIGINTLDWLRGYQRHIQYGIDNNIKATDEISEMWYKLQNGIAMQQRDNRAVSALISTKWDQGVPYNNLCPQDNSAGYSYGNRTVTGCVATAMAQVMKYWNYPTKGTGSHSYSHSSYGTLSANFGNTTYDWSNMPNTLSSYSTSAQKTAVATLMYHCGVAVEMNYDIAQNGGSGAYSISYSGYFDYCAENALKNFFGYKSTIRGLVRSSYTDTYWKNLIKTELDASRPVIYSGSGDEGGHCFVCDGYNSSDYFHFNWGWSGSEDGFFLLDAMTPGSGGIGGGGYEFNDDQDAVIGIEPANFTVEPSSLSYTAAGSSKTITVTSTSSWTATSSASWLTISPTSGSSNGTITAVAAANTSSAQRTATITVSSSGSTRTVSVTQAGTGGGGSAASSFTYDFESCTAWTVDQFSPCTTYDGDGSATGGIRDVTFNNQGYIGSYIVFENGLASSFSSHGGTKFGCCMYATTPANNDWFITPAISISNGTTFSFWARSANDSYGLEQFKVAISNNNTSFSTYLAGSSSASVSAPVEWTQYTYDLSAYAGQTKYIAIMCVSNDVFAFFIDDIVVSAPASSLTVSPSSLSYVAAGESKTVTVTSNTSWTATSSASWLTVSPASGSNNGTITAVAAANTSTQQRTATITVSGSGITCTVNVTQAGAPTAIDEEVAEGISIYPNPTNGMFTVGFGSIEGKVTCQIVNARGSVIETREVNASDNSEVIFNTNVAAGVYFVRIISGDSVWTERVVIEK